MTLTKRYYSIGEVAKIIGVATSTVRFWEGEFGKLHAKKSKEKDRKFTQRNIRKIQRIYELLKIQGYTIKGAIKQMAC
jgi:DNA-binding transcriptional MerR regulator